MFWENMKILLLVNIVVGCFFCKWQLFLFSVTLFTASPLFGIFMLHVYRQNNITGVWMDVCVSVALHTHTQPLSRILKWQTTLSATTYQYF